MINAKIILDSLNVCCKNRITTYVLVYPRFIHSELMTHRVFSRNAKSSRAMSITQMIKDVSDNPVIPMHWGKNKIGMSADEEVSQPEKEKAIKTWINASKMAISYAEQLNTIGIHKQVVNRLLEPFSHITTLVTATEYDNFFKLRVHKAAQPEIRQLANEMLHLLKSGTPKEKSEGEWHIPFCEDIKDMEHDIKLKVATACAARVSYNKINDDYIIDDDLIQKDIALHDRLLSNGHLSPFEHSAKCVCGNYANFKGWRSYRNILGE